MATCHIWRHLGGQELVAAQLAARWFVHADDTIGGWAVMPADMPPSSGVPAVACFLARECAEHIVTLHNAAFADRRDAAAPTMGRGPAPRA
jgi:hypothetical protein